jgi:hypothetical protein
VLGRVDGMADMDAVSDAIGVELGSANSVDSAPAGA